MTDLLPLLHDYARSRAVLVGNWDYTHLPPVPAAEYSLRRMGRLLTGPWCGWPADRVSVLGNKPGPGELPDLLLALFEDATDAALFYYVGHGQIDDEDQLCLGLASSRTEPHRRAATSLPFAAVRRALAHSPAATKILVLDCCFAGLACHRDHALGPRDDLLDKTTGTGAYTMAASSAYTTAWYETAPDVPEPQTYFTKYLADLIETGIPGQPANLTLHVLFTQLHDNLARDHRPAPQERSVDAARDFVFARNAARAAGSGARDAPPPAILARRIPAPRRITHAWGHSRVAVTAIIAAGSMAGAAGTVMNLTAPSVGSTAARAGGANPALPASTLTAPAPPASVPAATGTSTSSSPTMASTSAPAATPTGTRTSGSPRPGQTPSPALSASCRQQTAAAPAGWETISVSITAGADPHTICISPSGSDSWTGLYLPRAPWPDYTISVKGRLTTGSWGWGLAGRAAYSAENDTLSGRAIQYDNHRGGYLDVDYPGTGPAKTPFSAATDTAWHLLAVTVRGSQYKLKVDGQTISQGTLSETSSGAFIRIWDNGTAELQTPVISPGS
jgi:Caspase domain